MPCSSEQYPGDQDTFESHKEARFYREKADEATRLLCGICKSLEFNRLSVYMSAPLKIWYAQYKKEDDAKCMNH